MLAPWPYPHRWKRFAPAESATATRSASMRSSSYAAAVAGLSLSPTPRWSIVMTVNCLLRRST